MFTKAKKFLKEVKIEFSKVSWPSKDELIGSTIVVVVLSCIVAIFIGVVDHLFAMILSLILR